MAKKRAASKSSKRKAISASKKKTGAEVKGEATRTKPSTHAPPSELTQTRTESSSTAPAVKSTRSATIPAEAALSFLRDTKGLLSWSLRDLSQTLDISREEAERVVALLQIQGYVQPRSHKAGGWITTSSGETVAGAKLPRFDRETVEAALTSLKKRIADTNGDRAATFQITRAVAFGDFLAMDRTRVQAAEVGIELARRNPDRRSDEIVIPHSAVEAREELGFLRQLRGRSALINLVNYSEWMGRRTHRKLF